MTVATIGAGNVGEDQDFLDDVIAVVALLAGIAATGMLVALGAPRLVMLLAPGPALMWVAVAAYASWQDRAFPRADVHAADSEAAKSEVAN